MVRAAAVGLGLLCLAGCGNPAPEPAKPLLYGWEAVDGVAQASTALPDRGLFDRLSIRCQGGAVEYEITTIPRANLLSMIWGGASEHDFASATHITLSRDGAAPHTIQPTHVRFSETAGLDLTPKTDISQRSISLVVAEDGARDRLSDADQALLAALAAGAIVRVQVDIGTEEHQKLRTSFGGTPAAEALAAAGCPTAAR